MNWMLLALASTPWAIALIGYLSYRLALTIFHQQHDSTNTGAVEGNDRDFRRPADGTMRD